VLLAVVSSWVYDDARQQQDDVDRVDAVAASVMDVLPACQLMVFAVYVMWCMVWRLLSEACSASWMGMWMQMHIMLVSMDVGVADRVLV
jgi:hypothetical protein